MKKIVSIHQPDFMPWLGFFKKALRSDILCVLDHVKNNPRDSAFWCRRVKILISGKEHWLSIPIQKSKGVLVQPINTMKLGNNKKALQQINSAYSKAPFYEEYVYLVKNYYNSEIDNLSHRNMEFIKSVFDLLEIETKIVYSSDIVEEGLSSNELLVEIVKRLEGNIYLSGDGSKGYQDDTIFESNNIRVIYNDFKLHEYPQLGDSSFVGGMSVIDALFNIGSRKTKELILRS